LTNSFGKSPNLYKAPKRYVPDQDHLHYKQEKPFHYRHCQHFPTQISMSRSSSYVSMRDVGLTVEK
jgi:hypothetical protein